MAVISIVMPVYNGEEFLRESIDSIITQTFTDWEFIIINEFGSNEKTTKILFDYEKKDSRIKIIQNQERLRISASMNAGLNASHGKYIARMDADDICAPDRLQIQYNFMEAHPEIDICGIKPTLFGEDVWDWKVETDTDILKSDTLFFTPFVHPTIMIRTDALNKNNYRYNESFRYTEDYEFFERISHNLRFTNINKSNLYLYRMHKKNATTVGGHEGIENYCTVMSRVFENLDINFSNEDIKILCVHTFEAAENVEDALDGLVKLDLLLKEIWWNKKAQDNYGIYPLFVTLHKRWMRAWECYCYNKRITSDGRIKAAIDRGLFAHETFYIPQQSILNKESPCISVVIPTFNSEKYIQDTLFSILLQTYENFEVLVVNEYGSNDRTVELVNMFHDSRVHVIQNEVKLGLADSLNEGIKKAKGKYIARADADDVYPVYRFEKQIIFLEDNPEISLCGSWQRHFGKRNYIHAPVEKPEQIKAVMMFKCDLCHSTIMFRKDDFIKNNLFYDKTFASEDFELWTRAVQILKFYNIPEVLGEYRWDGENITASKMEILITQEQRIVARTLTALGIHIKDSDLILLSGWNNVFQDYNRADRNDLIKREEKLLERIESQNNHKHVYDKSALHEIIEMRRKWMRGDSFATEIENTVSFSISIKTKLKKIIKRGLRCFKPLVVLFFKPMVSNVRNSENSVKQVLYNTEGHLKDYIQKELTTKINSVKQNQEELTTKINSVKQNQEELTTKIISVAQNQEELTTKINGVTQNQKEFEKTINEVAQQIYNTIWDSEGKLKDQIKFIQTHQTILQKIEKNKNYIFLLGTPFSSNLGDQAQTLAIRKLCEDKYPDYQVIEIPTVLRTDYYLVSLFRDINDKTNKNDKIFVQGGIRVSDLYENELLVLKSAIIGFTDKEINVFPTTINFTDSDKAKELATMCDVHGNVKISARDPVSYKNAKELFSEKVQVDLCPDIVHYLYGKFKISEKTRNGKVLICKRHKDKENLVSVDDINTQIQKLNTNFDYCDTVINLDADFITSFREEVIKQEIQKYSEYSVVVTDRMHGMIFSLLAKTPVIVLPTSTGKTQNSIDFYSKNVYLCNDIKLLDTKIKEVMTRGWLEFSKEEILDDIEIISRI